jgi:hypothetical protein
VRIDLRARLDRDVAARIRTAHERLRIAVARDQHLAVRRQVRDRERGVFVRFEIDALGPLPTVWCRHMDTNRVVVIGQHEARRLVVGELAGEHTAAAVDRHRKLVGVVSSARARIDQRQRGARIGLGLDPGVPTRRRFAKSNRQLGFRRRPRRLEREQRSPLRGCRGGNRGNPQPSAAISARTCHGP